MNKQKQTRRVSRAKLRELLTATVDEICAAQDKVTLSLTGNTFGIHIYGAQTYASQKICKNACSSEKSAYLCSDLHLNRATTSPTATAAGLFYGRGLRHNISSVPCGALMRPLPCSRCKSTGSGTFYVSAPEENINTLRFI